MLGFQVLELRVPVLRSAMVPRPGRMKQVVSEEALAGRARCRQPSKSALRSS